MPATADANCTAIDTRGIDEAGVEEPDAFAAEVDGAAGTPARTAAQAGVAGEGDGGRRLGRGQRVVERIGGVEQAARRCAPDGDAAAARCAGSIERGVVEADVVRGKRDFAAFRRFAHGGKFGRELEFQRGTVAQVDAAASRGAGSVEACSGKKFEPFGQLEQDFAAAPGESTGDEIADDLERGNGFRLDRAAGTAAGVERATEFDGLAADFDTATGLNLAGDIERAGIRYLAAVEHDLAALAGDALGFDHAAVVHRAGQQLFGAAGGEDDGTFGSLDQATVFGQVVERGLLDAHADQAIAGEIDVDFAGRCQHYGALRGVDLAAVPDHWRNEGDQPAGRQGDLAFVDDGAGATVGELVEPRHEIGVGELLAGGDEAGDVDLAAFAEHHASRVDEIDLAIGRELAENLRSGPAVEHAVQGRAVAGGLDETDGGILTDVEALPVGDHAVADLVHRHGGAGLRDAADALPADDLAAAGQSIGGDLRKSRRWQDAGQERKQDGAGGTLAPALDGFGHGHPGAGQLVPDQAVSLVHGVPVSTLGKLANEKSWA